LEQLRFYGGTGTSSRREYQLLSTTKRRPAADWSFELRDGERAVAVDVHTTCGSSARCTVQHAGRRMEAPVGGTRRHQPTTVASELQGPGSVQVTVQAGDGEQHFLVIAHIACP